MTPATARDGTIRVVLTDDHKVVREGLRSFLDAVGGFEIIGEAADGGAAVRLVETLVREGRPPHVVLMDIVMTPVDGITATRALKRAHADVDVIAMTSLVDEVRVIAALEAGAAGCIVKDAGAEEFADAIRAVKRGEVHIDPAMAQPLMQRLHAPSPPDPLVLLTDREREVLALVARGQANKQIAVVLDISERTARTHVSNILAKLDLHSRTQAALYAVRTGLVDV